MEHRLSARILLAGLMGTAALVIVWLALRLPGDPRGMQPLPGPDGSTVSFLLPETAGDDPAAVIAAPADAWQPWPGTARLTAPAGKSIWLRVTLKNPGPLPLHGVLANSEQFVDHADAFLPDDSAQGGWRWQQSGEWPAASQRALWGRDTAFPVTVPAQGECTIFVQLRDHFRVSVTPVWWPDQSAFHTMRTRRTLAEGLYFGTLLALLFYNVVLWARLRFPDTGPYLLYLIFFSIFILVTRGGPAMFGLYLGSPVMETILTAAHGLSCVFLLEFARRFLAIPSPARAIHVTQRLLLVLVLGGLVTPWIRLPMWLMFIGIGICTAHLMLIWVAWSAWRRGERRLGSLVLIFGLVFSGLLPFTTISLSALSVDQSGVLVMAGSALEMLLLSLAVAGRYAGLQREKIAAQAALLEEAEQRRAIQEAYADELALEVRERTRELQLVVGDKDRLIAILGHDLRGPLTGLTRRAEQLASQSGEAGAMERFPHETAELGGRLLSLVEELVVWGHARTGAGVIARHAAATLVEPILALHRDAAAGRGLRLETHLPEGLEISTDLVQARTLVRNLLSNALKSARTQVIVRAEAVPGGVKLTVCDDGPGLPEALADGLRHDGPGLPLHTGGLGLRLCREISRLLGSRLEAVTPHGGGTEVSFVLGSPMEEPAS